MLVTRLTTPAFPLIADATLREWLRIDAAVDAATLALLLASAQDYLEGQTGQALAAADYRVGLDLASYLLMPLLPVNAITAVVVLTPAGSSTLAAGTDYQVNANSARQSITIGQLDPEATGIQVTLNAGYQAQAAVPASLQHAAAVLVAAGYDNRAALDPATAQTVANLIARYRVVGL